MMSNNNINIMLIEDNQADSRLVDIYLKNIYGQNYSLSVFETLSEGLAFKGKSDVIISDISLSDSRGINTFTKLFTAYTNIPIIILTGYGDEDFGIDAVKKGAADFLNKNDMNSIVLMRSITYSIERFKQREKLIDYTKKIEANKKQLATAQHYAKMGNWEWDLENDTTEWSDELYRIYGCKPGKVKVSYEWFLSRIHPLDLEYVKSNMAERLQNHKPFDYYFRIILSDGKVKNIHGIGEVFTDKNKKVIRMSGIDHDITDIVQKKELETLSMVATQSINSVIIADRTGKIEWANEGFQKLSGYNLDEIKGIFADQLNPKNSSGLNPESEHYQKLIKTREPVFFETIKYKKSGQEYWVLTTLNPVMKNKGSVDKIIAIDTDISLRKQIEDDLILTNKIAEHSLKKGNKALTGLIIEKNNAEQAYLKAEAATKLKDVFLANMSHEIRTPMNAIMGFSDILSKRDLGDEENSYVKIIKSAGENLLAIINDILDISKIEAGMMSFEANNFSIKETFKSLKVMLMVKAREKNLDLAFSYDDDVPDFIIGDHTRLSQILINLSGNAIKFTTKGSVQVHAKVRQFFEDQIFMEFSIKDTGIGISKQNMEHIFDRFRQAESNITRIYGGTGLGLSIAKQLIELQGGTLTVESELKVGSVFTFCIPYKISLQSPELIESFKPNYKIEDLSKLKILFVEDNPLNVLLIKSLFTENKLSFETAENGSVCIEKLKGNNGLTPQTTCFDIVLMDMEMPVMNGYEATNYIRKEMQSTIPIIAMTAHAMAGEREKCLSLGMNDYISKPISANILFEKIYNHTFNTKNYDKQ